MPTANINCYEQISILLSSYVHQNDELFSSEARRCSDHVDCLL